MAKQGDQDLGTGIDPFVDAYEEALARDGSVGLADFLSERYGFLRRLGRPLSTEGVSDQGRGGSHTERPT